MIKRKMADVTTPLNFNAHVTNSTQTPIKFEYNETLDNILIRDSSNYSLSVTGLKVPTDGLETFVMDNPNDYTVTVYGGGNETLDNFIFTVPLPSTDAVDPDSGTYNVCNGFDVKYYSPQQFVDILSRTMYRAFRGFYRNNTDPYNKTFSITLANSGSAASTITGSVDVSPVPSTLNSSFIAEISFTLSNFALTSLNTALPLTAPFQIWANAPGSSNYYVIFSSSGFQNFSTMPNNVTIRLSECAYAPFPPWFQPTTTLTPNVYAQPTTSFLSSFCNSFTCVGTWNFSITCNIIFRGSVTITVEAISCATNKPALPPLLSLDSTTKKLSLEFQSNWAYTNLRLAFSPKLYAMINFGASYTYYNTRYGWYEIVVPPLASSNATAPISAGGREITTLVQQQATMYNMMNITRIVVKSSNLRCDSEYGRSLVSDNVISDFKIDTDVEYLGDLTYTTDAGGIPWRRYKITGHAPTRQIDLSFSAEYDNGQRRDIYIQPGLEGHARISFFKE